MGLGHFSFYAKAGFGLCQIDRAKAQSDNQNPSSHAADQALFSEHDKATEGNPDDNFQNQPDGKGFDRNSLHTKSAYQNKQKSDAVAHGRTFIVVLANKKRAEGIEQGEDSSEVEEAIDFVFFHNE